ncbi:MAG: hypothetical protein ABJC26_05690 [Gemmatimonadaceae bacterium]
MSPLETRWEAIEECERAFRGTKLRVSTDNVGLAQLKEGTELVRIGAPMRPEFAAWRYGDQFGKRQRKFVAMTSAGLVGMVTPSIAQLYVMRAHYESLWPIATIIGSMYCFQAANFYKRWRDTVLPRLTVRDDEKHTYRMTHSSANCAKLNGNGKGSAWELKLLYFEMKPSGPIAKRLGGPEKKSGAERTLILRGKRH